MSYQATKKLEEPLMYVTQWKKPPEVYILYDSTSDILEKGEPWRQ